MSLAELKLSVRAMNCLESENIHTVRDLVQKTEDQLLEVRNFGETTLNEVKRQAARARAVPRHAGAGAVAGRVSRTVQAFKRHHKSRDFELRIGDSHASS